MQPVQPYTINTPAIYRPIQNQIPNKVTFPKITELPTTYTPPLSGLIAPPVVPQPTPEVAPQPTPAVVSVPPLAGIPVLPEYKPISVPANNHLSDSELDNIQKDLYDKKQFSTLSKMGKEWNYENLYEKVKNNQDFNELINSKFYQGHKGFMNILETIRSLDEQRSKRLENPFEGLPVNGIVVNPCRYNKYNIPDYLRIINQFIKSPNYSDDLKIYYMNTEGKKIDSYYGKLDSVSKVTNPLDALNTLQQ